jgi:hypothetical protein
MTNIFVYLLKTLYNMNYCDLVNALFESLGDFVYFSFCDKIYPVFKTKNNEYIYSAIIFNEKLNCFNVITMK